MSYKRVVKKKGKVYGPYVYESYRDEDGNVKKRYLGKQKVKKKISAPSVLLVGVLALFLIVGISYTTDFLLNDAEVSRNIFGLAMDFFVDTYSGFTGLIVGETESEEAEEAVVTEEIAEAEAEPVEEEVEDAVEEPAEVEAEEDVVEEPVEAETGIEDVGEIEVEGVVENETLADIDEAIVELNETLINETIDNETVEVNETILNETVINETLVDVNETIINETIVEVNETIINETIVNETIVEENVTLVNETILNESVVFVVEDFTMLQYKAVINKPVKWLKKINVSEVESLSIEIPKLAENISVLINGEIGEAEGEIEDYDSLVNEADKGDIVSGVLTGYVAMDIKSEKGILMRIWDWILGFTISGNVVLEEELEAEGEISETLESKIVDVENIVNETDAEEVAVEYYTPAPVAVVEEFFGGKLVTISADDIYNYTDILAYSLIDEMNVSVDDSSKLNVYWRTTKELGVRGTAKEFGVRGLELGGRGKGELPTTDDQIPNTEAGKPEKENVVEDLTDELTDGVLDYVKVAVNFSVYDLDDDGFVDYVEWIVPHLSEQVYEISISILNVQSYPTVGGNWTVGFNTTGVANLTISAYDETSYGFEGSPVDLEFLELKCGDEIQNVSVLINGTEIPYDVYLKKKRIEEIRRELDGS